MKKLKYASQSFIICFAKYPINHNFELKTMNTQSKIVEKIYSELQNLGYFKKFLAINLIREPDEWKRMFRFEFSSVIKNKEGYFDCNPLL